MDEGDRIREPGRRTRIGVGGRPLDNASGLNGHGGRIGGSLPVVEHHRERVGGGPPDLSRVRIDAGEPWGGEHAVYGIIIDSKDGDIVRDGELQHPADGKNLRGAEVVAAEHPDRFWEPFHPVGEVGRIGRRFHAIAEKEVFPEAVLLPERWPVDCGTDSVFFQKCGKCISPPIGEDHMAVPAEGDVDKLVLQEMLGGEASDGFGINPYGCEPWIIMFAQAVHDRFAAGGEHTGGAAVGDAAYQAIVTIGDLAGDGIRVDQRQGPIRMLFGHFCYASYEIASVGA